MRFSVKWWAVMSRHSWVDFLSFFRPVSGTKVNIHTPSFSLLGRRLTVLWELLTNRFIKHSTLKALCETSSFHWRCLKLFVCECFQHCKIQFMWVPLSESWTANLPCYLMSELLIQITLKTGGKSPMCAHAPRADRREINILQSTVL